MVSPPITDNYLSKWGLLVNNNSELTSGGCSITDVVREYGTPLFIINDDHLNNVCKDVINSFRRYYPDTKIFYSYKTNTVPSILEKIHRQEIGAEVTTGYELWLALQQGVRPENIIFNGPNKTKKDLRIAIDKRIRMINIDSEEELILLDELALEADRGISVGVRLAYPLRGGTQFGFMHNSIIHVFQKILSNKRLIPEGIHIHIGSNVRYPKTYNSVLKIAFRLIKRLKSELDIDIKILNMGGGFGVPTVKTLSTLEMGLLKLLNITPSPPSLNKENNLSEQLSFAFKNYCRNLKNKPLSLFVEPGRLLTGSSQMLILRVISVKERWKNKGYAILDGGVYNTAFPLLYEYHECIVANRIFEKPKYYYTMVGPTCTPSDILYRKKHIQKLKKGDLIAVMDAGAYFIPLSSNFGFPRPAVVGLSGGKCRLLRKREDYEDMSAMDII